MSTTSITGAQAAGLLDRGARGFRRGAASGQPSSQLETARGDVSFDGATEQPDGVSLSLAYSVETVPASVDRTPADTTTPRDVIEGGG